MPRLTTQSDVLNPKRKGYDFRIDNFLLLLMQEEYIQETILVEVLT